MSVPAPTTRRVWKFLQFPVTRIVLGFMVIGVAVSFGQAVAQSLPGSDTLMVSLLSGSAVALLAIFAYAGFVRLIEKRPVSEVALSRALAELGSGALVGAVLFTVTIGVLWALGYYHVAGLNHWTSVMPMLTVAIRRY